MTVSLPHRLDRTLVIHAKPQTVFEFFTSSPQWASWWGAGSTIEPHPGGTVYIRYPNGVEVSGSVVEVRSPERITFTYGYVSGNPIPVGSSRVTIRLDQHPQGTLLQLTHEFSEAAPRDQHANGWRFQLSVFANAIANAVAADATAIVDQWFAAWSASDAVERDRLLEAITAADVRMEDRFSCFEGLDDLRAHISGMQQFMPGARIERRGTARRAHWTVIADWTAVGTGGEERGSGTNVFTLNGDRKIQSVVGVWNG